MKRLCLCLYVQIHFRAVLFAAAFLCSYHGAPCTAEAEPFDPSYVFISDLFRNSIVRLSLDGQSTDGFSVSGVTLRNPAEMITGPKGYIYVRNNGGQEADEIVRIDPRTGEGEVFVQSGYFPSGRGLDFGPNGNLFVVDTSGRVMEFDGNTGTYLGNFVTGISTPIAPGFGPDGNLYVARGHHQLSPGENIRRYDGLTGEFLGVFASSGVDTPQNIVFGPDGDLYVTNQLTYGAVRLDGETGAIVRSYASDVSNGQGLVFLPDGNMLLATGRSYVRKYATETGHALGNFYNGGSFTMGLTIAGPIVPEPSVLVLGCTALLSLIVVGMRTRLASVAKRR